MGDRSLLFGLLLVVSQVFLGESSALASCAIDGRFRDIVHSSVGAERAGVHTSYAMAVVDVNTGQTLCEDSVEKDRNIYPASTIKTLVAIATLMKLDRGEITLQTRRRISQSNANEECMNQCNRYGLGRERTIDELLYDMIAWSNNIATNELIDVVGRENINVVADRLGAPGLRVFRKLYVNVNSEPNITERNRANASGFVELFREVATGRLGLLQANTRWYLAHLLSEQKHNNRFNARFPDNVVFFHKTGSTSDTSSDSGYYYLNADKVVILVGLQDFRNYTTLQEIGERAYRLSRDFEN